MEEGGDWARGRRDKPFTRSPMARRASSCTPSSRASVDAVNTATRTCITPSTHAATSLGSRRLSRTCSVAHSHVWTSER